MQTTLLEHLPLLLILAAYVVSVWTAERYLGLANPLGNVGFGNAYLVWAITVIGYLMVRILWLRSRVRDQKGEWLRGGTAWRIAWDELRRRNLTFDRLVTVFLSSGAVVVLLRTYASWKPLITTVVPFRWDTAFMLLDQQLHFGVHPWALLQPVMGYPGITLPIDLLYALWHPVNCAVVIWLAWGERSFLRTQFLLAYALVWILLGTLAATALSSAGPCYYARVISGSDPYQPLLAYLHSLHASHGVIAVTIQENLWSYYSGGSGLPVNGISAMPSVHVAAAVLFTLVGWKVGRAAGIVFTAYAAVVLLGSIHLGWHYAVDGYASALAAAFLWIGCGWLTRRWFRVAGLQ